MFKLGLDQQPLEVDNELACGATFSPLENTTSTHDLTAAPNKTIKPQSAAPQTPETVEGSGHHHCFSREGPLYSSISPPPMALTGTHLQKNQLFFK